MSDSFVTPWMVDSLGSSVRGISQARILEWVAFSFSRGSSQPRGQTQVSWIAGRFFTAEPPGHTIFIKNQMGSEHGIRSFAYFFSFILMLILRVSILSAPDQKWKPRLRSTFSEIDWPAMTLKQNQVVPFCILLNTTNKILEVMGKLQRKDSCS